MEVTRITLSLIKYQKSKFKLLILLGLVIPIIFTNSIVSFAQKPAYKKVDLELLSAARDGDVEKVKSALSAGANINIRDEDDMSPLMRAVRYKHIKVVEALIENNPQPNPLIFNKYGESALMDAAWQGNMTLVLMVLKLEKAADSVRVADFRGNTILIRSIMGRNLDIIRMVLAMNKGAIDKKNVEGETPLIWAVQGNYPETVKMLLAADAKIETKDKKGRTPLITAAQSAAYSDVLQILLDAGDDVNKADDLGKTALIYAVERVFNDRFLTKNRITTLLKAGANAYTKDKSGKSAIDYAKETNNKYVLDLLTGLNQ